MFDCILLMAGSGKRANLGYNKIKYEINNKALYEYSLELFSSLDEVGKIVMVVSNEEYAEFTKYQSDRIKVVKGGKERQDSVKEGLKECSEEVVLVHDGARPNITKEEVLQVYEAALENHASVLAVPCVNAIKEVKDGLVTKSLDRSTVWCMQTPQGANRQMLEEALKQIDYLIYDDIQALEIVYGIKAKIVLGRQENIKVTNKMDLKIMEVLLGENNETDV